MESTLTRKATALVVALLAALAIAFAPGAAWVPGTAWADSTGSETQSDSSVASVTTSDGDTETTLYYDTLSDAIGAASDSSASYTITLLANTTVSTQLVVTTDVTLDLAGFTITLDNETYNSGARLISVGTSSNYESASLTVKDSSADGTGTIENTGYSYGLFDVYGALTIESGTYIDQGSGDGATIKGRYTYDSSTYELTSMAEITITGGTFTTTYTNYNNATANDDGEVSCTSNYFGNYIISATYSIVTITGGTFSAGQNCWGAIKLAGCYGYDAESQEFTDVSISDVDITTYDGTGIEVDYCDVTVSDSTITVQSARTTNYTYISSAFAVCYEGTITVESGTYSAPYAVYVYSSGGSVVIEDGDFTGTTAVLKVDAVASSYQDDEGSVTGSITVEGGSFDGEISVASDDSASLTVEGGTYTDSDVTEYIDTSEYAYTVRSGTVSVEYMAVAAVNGVEYDTLQEAVDAASAGDTVELLRDVELDGYVKITKAITLDLGGFTITGSSSANYVLCVVGTDDVTITNGTIEVAYYIGLYLQKGSCTISDLTINANTTYGIGVYVGNSSGTGYYGKLTMEDGCTINCSGYYAVQISSLPCSSEDTSVFTMNGGTINCSGTADGVYIGGSTSDSDEIGEDNIRTYFYLNGGTINVSTDYYAVVGNGSSHNTYIEINGGTITSASGTAIFHPQWGIININGGTITGGTAGIELRAGVLTVTGGSVTCTATSFDTNTTSPGSGNTVQGAAVAVSQHSTNLETSVVISGGTLTGYYALYETDLMDDDDTDDISLCVTGGTFVSTATSTSEDEESSSSTASAVYSENCTAFVSGGSFSTALTSTYAAVGYTATTTAGEDGYYTVEVASDTVATVTTSSSDGTTSTVAYSSLALAIAAVGTASSATDADAGATYTVTLLTDTELSASQLIGYSLTLDLGGHTISEAEGDEDSRTNLTYFFGVYNSAEVTIENGTIALSQYDESVIAILIQSASLTTQDLTITLPGSSQSAVQVGSKAGAGSYTMEDGTVINASGDGSFGVFVLGYYSSTDIAAEGWSLDGDSVTLSTFTMNGGEINCTSKTDTYAITGNGTCHGTSIVINGGSVTCTNGVAIYHPQYGYLTLNGGTITGHTGIQMCSGILTVPEDSTVVVTSTGTDNSSSAGSDGTIPDGAALSVVNRGYPNGPATISIAGGTFKATGSTSDGTVTDAIKVYTWTYDSSTSTGTASAWYTSGEISISGGSFSSVVDSLWCASGFVPVTTADDDGLYTVESGSFVASVSTTSTDDDGDETTTVTGYYTDLQAAIDAASSGDTVTLLADTTISDSYLEISKSLTLDLGDSELTFATTSSIYNAAIYISDGDVTIKNGTITDRRCYGYTAYGVITVWMYGDSLTTSDVTIQTYAPNSTSDYNYILYIQPSDSNYPSVTLDDGTTIKDLGNSHASSGYQTLGCVGVTILGAYSTSVLDESADNYGITEATTVSLTVKDGVTIYTESFAISGNGAYHGTDITIEGGTITSYGGTATIDGVEYDTGGTAIYHPQYGTLTITGGTITGADTGVEIRAGVLAMSGGSVTGEGAPTETQANGNGTTSTGAGIAVSQHTTNLTLSVTITGGTVTGYTALYEEDTTEDGDTSGISLSVTGGTFISTDTTGAALAIYSVDCTGFVSAGSVTTTDDEGNETTAYTYPASSTEIDSLYCAEGYVPTDTQTVTVTNDDGTTSTYYTITSGSTVAYVYSVVTSTDEDGNEVATETLLAKYASLQDAIDAAEALNAEAEDGTTYTVKMAADVTADIIIYGTVTLDLAGYTLTNSTTHTITVASGGNLTVIDSSATGEYGDDDVQGAATGTGVVDNTTTKCAALYVQEGGVATLAGGTFKRSAETGTSTNTYYTILNQGTLTIADGTTVELLVYTTDDDGNTTTTAAGYSSIIDNGWYSGSPDNDGDVATLYITGGYINGGKYVKNDSYGVMYISGGTITGSDDASAILNWNVLEVSGGTVESDGYCAILNCATSGTDYETGSVTITGGTFTYGEDSGDSAQLLATNSTSTDVTISGGSFSTVVDQDYCADGYAPTTEDATTGLYTVEEFSITLESDTFAYTGSVISPILTVTFEGETLTSGTDYSVSYTYVDSDGETQSVTDDDGNACAPTDAGTYTMTVTGIAYSRTDTYEITITAKSLTDSTVSTSLSSESFTYNGSSQVPVVTVTDSSLTGDSQTLEAGTDYVVYYNSSSSVDVGSYTLTVVGTGNYTDSVTLSYTITAAEITSDDVTVATATYTGETLTPGITVTVDGTTLVADTDYTVSYAEDTTFQNATTYSDAITITGTGNYTGTVTASFTISAASIADQVVTVSTSAVYSGTSQTPTVTITNATTNSTLTQGTDYTVAYADSDGTTVTELTAAGTYTVTITGTGNYTGTAEYTFTITENDITDATISTISSQTYTGSSIEPSFTVTVNGTTLTKDTDYTVSYSNNVEVGTATVTITGCGNYSGVLTTTFEIAAASISGATVTVTPTSATYTGSALEATSVTVTLGESDSAVTLTEGTDYTVSYSNNTNVGTATVTVAGTGNYKDTATGTFTISAASISGATILVSDQTYTGSALEPEVTVILNGVVLTKGTDYTVSYSNNTNAGTATVTVTGTGNYTDTASNTFTINAIDLSAATVTLSGTSFTYDGETHKAEVSSVSLNGATLTENTDYTVTYSADSFTDAGTYTVTITGMGNYTGSTTATWTIAQAATAVTMADATVSYTGAAQSLTATVVLASDGTAVEGAEATVTYYTDEDCTTLANDDGSAPTAVGTYYVEAVYEGTSNYAGSSTTATLVIENATIEYTAVGYDGVYDGEEHSITVTATTTGATVTYYSDNTYTTALESNPTYTDAGTYTVYYQISLTGYTTVSGSATVTIAKATPTITMESVSTTYGSAYSVSATVTGVSSETSELTATYAYYTDEDCTTAWEASGSETQPTDAGTYYVKATYAGSDNYESVSTTATLTIAKADQDISYASSEVSVHLGDTVSNTLTQTTVDGTVTYASSDESVATVDSTGAVTIVGAGTATITATAAATMNYNEASASYTLTVSDHTYGGDPTWAWTSTTDDDGTTTYTAATATFSCAVDGCTATTEVTATVVSVTTDATCTEAGSVVYTATAVYNNIIYTDTKTVTIEATGHTAGDAVTENEVEATCTEDGSYDTVVYCAACGEELSRETTTVAATGHSYESVVTEPTCTEGGYTTYTCSVCGDTYTSDKTEATGHTYKVNWTWTDDYSQVIAVATCSVCGETEYTVASVTYEVTQAATCTEDGTITYKSAEVTFGGSGWGTETFVTVEATGHTYDYDSLTWTWSDDYSSATVSYSCSTCGDTQTVEATVTSSTTDATCEEAGSTTYTATATVNGETVTDVATTTTAALGHTYGTVSWTWSDDCSSAVASVTCTVCGATAYADAEVTSQTTAATCTEDGAIVYTATATVDGVGASTTKTVAIEATGHSYEAVVTEPTCTEAGYATYTCSVCGDTYTADETEATGHSYESEVTTEATCTEEGTITYTCSTCGDTYTEAIEATGHTAGDAVIENEVAATCTEDGSYDTVVYCSVCGEELSRETTTVAATGHSYEAVETEPTCTEAGYTTYTCSVCGDMYVADETEATGHSYASEVTTEATCTEDGVTTYTCSTCGDTYTEAIDATGHNYDYANAVWTWTETDDGYAATAIVTCANDGGHTVTLEATVETTSTTDATCTEAGAVVYTATVTVDGTAYTDTKTVEVAATGHSYDLDDLTWTWAEDYSMAVVTATCQNETGYAVSAIATVEVASATEATCTEDGSIVYTATATIDGVEVTATQTETVAAAGHSYASETTEATCTEDGAVTYTCSVCGDTYTEAIAATGHTEGDAVVENSVDATCTEDGSYDTVVYCSVCGEELSRETTTVAATGHSYEAIVTDPTCTEAGYTTYTCSVCGDTYTSDETEATGHDYVAEVAEATCTEDGAITYTCSVCGDTFTETVEATGHSYEAVVTDPTCTEGGYTTYTCSVCGDTYTDDETEATGHSYASEVTAEATCTEDGETTYTCSTCGDVYTEVIEATGHSYNVVETAATCTQDGYLTYTCTVCGDTYMVASGEEATGHTWGEWVVVTDATCEADGFQYRVCEVCGYTETEGIDATGHTWEDDCTVDVEATCTTDGSRSIHCASCDAVKDSEAIAATGHSYEVTATTSATCEEDGTVTYTCSVCGDTYTVSGEAALGHDYDYDNPTWTWADDYSTATVSFVCANDADDVLTIEATVTLETTDATCEEAGSATYTATATVEGVTVSGTVEVELEAANGHTWTTSSEEWDDDYSSATFELVCEECGETQTVVATSDDATDEDASSSVGTIVYEVTIEPTATEDGEGTYTATYEVDGQTFTSTVTVVIPATGETDDDADDEDDEDADWYFLDVMDASKYYYTAVYAVADAGYITGYQDSARIGYFGVGDGLTRAQMVTILWRIACPEDYASYVASEAVNETGLPDVEDGKYYTEAVNWAMANGVITGKYDSEGNAYFDPYAECTFQQFCTILARYLAGGDEALEASMTDAEADEILSSFTDCSAVSGYANKAIAYLVSIEYDEAGGTVVGGTADGLLKPTGAVARERAVTVIYRLMLVGLLG